MVSEMAPVSGFESAMLVVVVSVVAAWSWSTATTASWFWTEMGMGTGERGLKLAAATISGDCPEDDIKRRMAERNGNQGYDGEGVEAMVFYG